MASLQIEKMDFYNRQSQIISAQHQKKLQNSTVLIAGVGGLGTPICQQLVRLGVGKIVIVDSGILDPPDLNRQILYRVDDLGKAKVDVAKARLTEIGLGTEIVAIQNKIVDSFELPENVDYVIDCLDNFEARYLLDDAVHKRNVPLIHGGIHGMYGQVATIIPGITPSLRRLFENSVPIIEGKIPVMAPIPSLVASFQTTEFVKLICGFSGNLKGRLLRIDLNDYSVEIFDLNV